MDELTLAMDGATTELLDKAVALARGLPSARQDEIAAAIISLADQEAEVVDPDHLATVQEGLAQIERGEFASDDEVASVFRRLGSCKSAC